MQTILRNGRALLVDGSFAETDLLLSDGIIREIATGVSGAGRARELDLDGLLLLPGIVDLHGDAFERQVMPRPKVRFPIDMALIDTDRQLIANGITTAYYGLTYSWEPGLRGREAAFAFIEALGRLRPDFLADARLHLRHEVYNIAAEDEILAWIAAGKIDLLAFNDHVAMIARESASPEKLGRYADRAGLAPAAFSELLQAVSAAADKVPASVSRLADAAARHRIPMASHDDDSPEIQRRHAGLGFRLCEFPTNRPTAEAARDCGSAILLGAPNVVRGGSHTANGPSAADLARDGLCSVLTSDYYYPALLQAPFRLARDGICGLAAAWALVSANPARVAGLADRGTIEPGQRADLIAVDTRATMPRIAAVFAGGAQVFTADRGLLP